MSDVDGLRALIAEESIDLTPGVVWTDAQLAVVRHLAARAHLAETQAEKQARQRAAEELRAAAEEIHALAPDLDWDDWLRARAAALADDGQP